MAVLIDSSVNNSSKVELASVELSEVRMVIFVLLFMLCSSTFLMSFMTHITHCSCFMVVGLIEKRH